MRGGLLLAAAWILAGCGDVQLSAVTAPPPGAVAELDDDCRTVRLSRGVALAIECVHTLDGPCGELAPRSSDEAVVRGLPGYSDALVPWYPRDDRQRSVFVVVGGEPGSAELSLATAVGDVVLEVEVVE